MTITNKPSKTYFQWFIKINSMSVLVMIRFQLIINYLICRHFFDYQKKYAIESKIRK